MNKIQEIDINLIDQNKEQPRKYFDKDKLEALKKSIDKDGLLQPIVVRSIQETGRYQIIAGERRYTALKELHRKTVPAIVLEADDKKALDLALLENEVRSDLTPLEKAEAIEEYKNRNNTTNEKIAELLGMTPSNISNITSLNRLVDKTKEELRTDPTKYPLRDLMKIARIDDPKKQRIAFSALKHRIKSKEENSEDAGNKDTTKKEKAKNTDTAKNDSIENNAEQKNIQLFQKAGEDLEAICSLDKQVFNDMPELTNNLFNNVAKTLMFFISSDFNALNLDALKTAITEIAAKLSAESANSQD